MRALRPISMATMAFLASCTEPPASPTQMESGFDGTHHAATQWAPVCSAMTHLWPGEGTAVDAVGANHGTLLNGVAFAGGMVGQAFSFDGVNDYMTVGDVLEEQAGTVEFWLKRGPVGGGSDLYFGAFVGQNLATGQSTPTFYVRDLGNLTWDIGNSFSHDAGPFSAGVWHHLAMTWSAVATPNLKEVKVFVDGVQVGDPVTATVSNFPQPYVGAFSFSTPTASQHANALIDELTIYNRALMPVEIAAIHAAGAAGKCGENQAPTADAGGPYQGIETNPLQFDGSASSDPDGDPLTYSWDFGDGSAGSGVGPTHTYGAAGDYTVTLTVEDGNGGSAQTTSQVQIHYAFAGFFAPVDNPGVAVNRAKAGSAIPVKFSLGGNRGLQIFLDGYPKASPYDCQSGDPLDTIEQTVQATANSLSYDAATAQYTYVWKTEKTWSNSCRRLALGLADGSDRYAEFNFTK